MNRRLLSLSLSSFPPPSMSNKFMLNAFAKLNKKAALRFFISLSLEKARRFRGEKHVVVVVDVVVVVVDVVLKTAGD